MCKAPCFPVPNAYRLRAESRKLPEEKGPEGVGQQLAEYEPSQVAKKATGILACMKSGVGSRQYLSPCIGW